MALTDAFVKVDNCTIVNNAIDPEKKLRAKIKFAFVIGEMTFKARGFKLYETGEGYFLGMPQWFKQAADDVSDTETSEDKYIDVIYPASTNDRNHLTKLAIKSFEANKGISS